MIQSPIFLMGYMASGKSRLGKQLAKNFQIPFFDLDAEIETEEGKSISQIFNKSGEAGFRKIEAETLRNLPNTPSIVALGGGTPIFHNNLDYILKIGISIYLKIEAKHLIGRLKERSLKRPLVNSLSEKELSAFVKNTLKEREEYYSKANYILTSNKPTISQILNLLED